MVWLFLMAFNAILYWITERRVYAIFFVLDLCMFLFFEVMR